MTATTLVMSCSAAPVAEHRVVHRWLLMRAMMALMLLMFEFAPNVVLL